MAPTLPAGSGRGPHLRDVLTSAAAAAMGEPNRLGLRPMRHAAVLLVDGLGAAAIAARAGHARFLAPLARRQTIGTGAPTTTAAAIACLATGTDAGEHGLVGYTARDPATGRVHNLLHAFDRGALPIDWQRRPTVFETFAARGGDPVMVGAPQYDGSGYTRAVLRGARYLPARTIDDRMAAAAQVLRGRGAPALVYIYVSELDTIAHAHGWSSPEWTAALETLDGAVADLEARLPGDVGLVITADHGIIDVTENERLVFDIEPGLTDEVAAIGGEARLLHLYLAPGADAAAVADRWADRFGTAVWTATRAQAIAAGWFGAVTAEVAPRIGDVLVAARARFALVDSRQGEHRMIGHHGSWTDEERRVPLVRLGAAAR